GWIKLEHEFNGNVDLRYFGIMGDGTDETSAIQTAFNKGVGGVVFVPNPRTNYLSGQIQIPRDITIQCDSEVRWKAIDTLNENIATFEVLFRHVNSKNVTWMCNNAVFYMNKAAYSSEHNSIFLFDSAINCEINGARIGENGGDGVNVTGFFGTGLVDKGSLTYSENIRLNNCIISGSKRNG